MIFRKLLRKIFQSNKQQQELSMLPKKYSYLPGHFSLLFEWGNPVLRGSGSYCNWENYLPYGFSDADVPALLELMSDSELNDSRDENEVWVPLYAWRILGQLESVEAVDSLMDLFEQYEGDDRAASEIPVVLAMIGKPVMALFARILLDENEDELRKNLASDTLYEMTLKHPELREDIVGHFRQYLQLPSPDYRVCNGAIVCHLMDMDAVELIEEIRTLYENGYADTRLAGDIEDVEIGFGLREDPFSVPDNPLGEGRLSQLPGATRSDALNRPTPEMPETYVREVPKVGRNEPCPCGSGKKYKRCCMNTSTVTS